MVSDPGKTPVPPLSQLLKQQRSEKRKSRPMAGRKNKEAREKAIEDHRAVSYLGGGGDSMLLLLVLMIYKICWYVNRTVDKN